MRNSEAQRYARWSAALAILLAVVVAGVYLRRVWLAKQAEKEAPPAIPATVEQRSAEFSFSKVEGQRTIFTVRASRATGFKQGGRNLLEDVSITVYGKKGDRNDTLSTRACEYISDTGEISCAGEVQINLQASGATPANAIQVLTSGVSFDQHTGQARTDKPVTFRWPAGEGRAIGVRYDSNNGTLYLERDVEMTMMASSLGLPEKTMIAPEQSLHLTGSSLTFRRESRTVLLQGDVRAQQTTHELSADSLLLELDSSLQARHLVASGRPRFQDSDVQGPIVLDADEISAELRPDRSVDFVVATGKVHGMRTTPAGEDRIDAGRLQMDLGTRRNVPRLLTAGGSVTLISRGAAAAAGTRRVESEALEMHFLNNSGTGPARLQSVSTLAPARVEWQNSSMADGKPVKQTMRMNGRQMNLRFDGQNQLQQLVSSGDVEITRQLGQGPEQTTASRELTAKFSGAGEWSGIDQIGDVRFREGLRGGQADRAHLDRATNTTTLDGSVILTDANLRTTAQSAVFTQGSNELRADGNVLTTELRAGTGSLSNFAPEPAHVSAEHLVADTARGRAVYSGNGRLWQGQSVIEADTIELDSLAHNLVARGKVRGIFPQAPWSPVAGQSAMRTTSRTPSRTPSQPGDPQTNLGHVRGGLLTYWDTESRARVEQDARLDSSQGSIQADQIDLYFPAAGAVHVTKQLSRAVATGNVTVRQGDRWGTSNQAEYRAAEGKFVLSGGKPTLYDSTGNTTTGRQLTFFFADDRIVVDSEEGLRTVTLHRVEK
jgi:LPS export ABC transporter protein LptC